jgi:hypothetical protein
MAITTLKLWMSPESNRLLSGPSSFAPAQNPVFYEGNTARIELHILAGAGVGKVPYEVPFPAGSAIKLAVGQVNAFPTSGTWKLMVDDVQTADMPFNATPAQVQTALNALAPVQAAGGVTCALNGDGYTITWNTYGSKPDIGIGSDTLVPSSYESISLVQQGTADHRKVVYVELRQAPVALGVDWDPLPAPVITVAEVTAWNGTTMTWRYTIDPAPKAGSYNLVVEGSETKVYTLVSSTTADVITTRLATDFPNTKVYKTGEAQFDIVFQEEVTLTADGNGLIGYLGYVGNVNFSTAEIHQFIGGLAGRQTTLEVAIESGGIPQTLIQVSCFVNSDVISNGVLAPLPLGTAMSEQVANARFVRRDLDQNPDSATLDVIWQNLGVETLGSDVAGALNAADSPSAANPFATISDIPTVTQAEWGNITGDINSQTDLASELSFLNTTKYDASNPAGFITQSDLAGFATYQWVTDQNYLSSSSSDIEFSGYNITFNNGVRFLGQDGKAPINIGATFLQPGGTLSNGDMWFNTADGRLGYYYTQQFGSGVRYAATTTDLQSYYLSSNPQGFITASALTPYATNASPALTGTATITNPPASGGLSVVTSGVNPYTSSLTSTILRVGFLNYQNANAYMTPTEVGVGGDATGLARLSTNSTGGANPQLYLWEYGPSAPIQGRSTIIKEGKFFVDNNQGDGPVEVYAPYAVLDTKANLSGAAFTGKVNFATISSSSPSINLGGQCDSAPASAANGDLWISNAVSPKITYRTGGVNYNVPVLNQFNTFTGQMVVDTSSSTTAALRVTQRGSGNAIEVEDSTTPDATRFVVDQFGKVGVGTAPDATAAIRIDANGISFNGLSFNPTGTASHTGGPDTLDLLVTINGTNYRLGLRPA